MISARANNLYKWLTILISSLGGTLVEEVEEEVVPDNIRKVKR